MELDTLWFIWKSKKLQNWAYLQCHPVAFFFMASLKLTSSWCLVPNGKITCELLKCLYSWPKTWSNQDSTAQFFARLLWGSFISLCWNLLRWRTRTRISRWYWFIHLPHQITKQWLVWSLKVKDHTGAGEQKNVSIHSGDLKEHVNWFHLLQQCYVCMSFISR